MRKLNSDITFDDVLEEELGLAGTGMIGMTGAAAATLPLLSSVTGQQTTAVTSGAAFLKFPRPASLRGKDDFISQMTRGLNAAVQEGLNATTDWLTQKVHKRLERNKIPYASAEYLYIMNEAIKKAYKRLHAKFLRTDIVNPWLAKANAMLLETVQRKQEAEATTVEPKSGGVRIKPKADITATPSAKATVKATAKESKRLKELKKKAAEYSHKDLMKLLKRIDQKLEYEALQKEATHEHAVLSGTNKFRDVVLNRLKAIMGRLTPGTPAYERLRAMLIRIYGVRL